MRKNKPEYRAYIPIRFTFEDDSEKIRPYYVYKDSSPPHESLPTESSRLLSNIRTSIVGFGEYLADKPHPINKSEPLDLLVVEKLKHKRRGEYAVQNIVQLEIIEEENIDHDEPTAHLVI